MPSPLRFTAAAHGQREANDIRGWRSELSEWMGENAFVSSVATEQSWAAESALTRSVCLPLNLAQNKAPRF